MYRYTTICVDILVVYVERDIDIDIYAGDSLGGRHRAGLGRGRGRLYEINVSTIYIYIYI